MAYPTKLLNRNEAVALDLRPHWWYFGRQILTGVPLLVVVVLTLSLRRGTFKDIVGWIVVVLVVAWAIWLVLKYMSWARTYFVVTNQRVIYRTGVIARHGVEIPLDRINNINFRQRVFERLIGAGNLDIESAGEQGSTQFDFVRHPDGVQAEIYRQMDSREAQAAGREADAVGTSIPEQIEQLAHLRDAGHITAAEFEAKKAELLGRM
jgi:uncharacterized membrane protein YdbT with pleckstrin-like domain